MTNPTEEELTNRRERYYTWFGYLADDNIEYVAQRIRNILEGRRYTHVFQNAALSHSVPEVRTSQVLTDGVKVHRMDELDYDGKPRDYASINFPDHEYTMGFYTHFRTEAEAYQADPKKVTYVVIEGGRTPDDIGRHTKVVFREYNAMSPRELLHKVFVPEHDYYNPKGK